MRTNKVLRFIIKIFDRLAGVLNWIAYISIIVIVLTTFVDVTGRYFFNKPLLGGVEILELLMATLGGVAMLYAATKRGHIVVDVLVSRFPKRAQVVIEIIGSILGFGIWGLIAYQVYRYAVRTQQMNQISALFHIPLAPFQFILAFGIFLFSLSLLVEVIRIRVYGKHEEEPGIEL